jgi:PmbA protein
MSSSPRSLSPSDFAYSRERFRELVDGALATAKALGASDAVAEVSEGVGLSVSVRKGETENVERNRDKSISITVYSGQRRGNASSSDFSAAAIGQTVRAAWDIARFTAEDSAAGLPDAESLATGQAAERDLDLFHPWPIDAEAAIAISIECEAAALAVDRRITNSEGAGVSAQQSHFYAANTRGFGAGYASSRHSLSVAPIASLPGKGGDDMQRDAWYTSMRSADELAAPAVGPTPPARAVAARLRRRSAPAKCRCSTNRRSPRGCSAPTSMPPAAARSIASRRSSKAVSASASSPGISTCARTRTCRAARAARRSTTKAS